MQSRNLVYRIFNFEMSHSVIKIAINVIRAELLALGIPRLGVTINNVEVTIVDDDPFNFSEIAKSSFNLNFCISSYNNHYQFCLLTDGN